jgi:hypothetical protein
MRDYGEPWYATVFGQCALDRVGFSTNTPRGTARAVACVNACQGIDDPAAAIQAAREALDNAQKAFNGVYGDDLACNLMNQCRAALALLTPKGKR